MNDLIRQLEELVAAAERNRQAAEKWHELVNGLRAVGYGPRISPEQIISLVPAPLAIDAVVAASQEAPAPGASKSAMPRRKLAGEDFQRIAELQIDHTPQQIAAELGVTVRAINEYLDS